MRGHTFDRTFEVYLSQEAYDAVEASGTDMRRYRREVSHSKKRPKWDREPKKQTVSLARTSLEKKV